MRPTLPLRIYPEILTRIPNFKVTSCPDRPALMTAIEAGAAAVAENRIVEERALRQNTRAIASQEARGRKEEETGLPSASETAPKAAGRKSPVKIRVEDIAQTEMVVDGMVGVTMETPGRVDLSKASFRRSIGIKRGVNRRRWQHRPKNQSVDRQLLWAC